jgi:hypothetical protein
MNKKVSLALAGLSLCLAGAVILKPSIIGIKTATGSNYKFLKTEHFSIRYSESLDQLVQATGRVIEEKIKEYEEFFDISLNKKIVINFFDNPEKFMEFMDGLWGQKFSMPYAQYKGGGFFPDGKIVICLNPKSQMRNAHMASHELFHLLYKGCTYKNDRSKRIVWYDEAMAQFMSGEKDHLKDGNKFLSFYSQVKKNTKIVPKLTGLHHGKEFINENYNGYDLSYLSIRYLHETLSPEEFKALYSDFDKIKTLGVDIVEKMFKYYDEKLGIEK